jgi:hypothetical protein
MVAAAAGDARPICIYVGGCLHQLIGGLLTSEKQSKIWFSKKHVLGIFVFGILSVLCVFYFWDLAVLVCFWAGEDRVFTFFVVA